MQLVKLLMIYCSTNLVCVAANMNHARSTQLQRQDCRLLRVARRLFQACCREDSVYFLKYENGRCPMGGRPRNIGCGKLCICRSFQEQDYQQHEFAADDQCS